MDNVYGTSDAHEGTRVPLRVLIVDDYPDLATTLSFMLRSWGCETHSAFSAVAALDTIPALLPDVIFVDVGLPEMNGLTLTIRIRELPIKQPYIVAFTGYGSPQDKSAAVAAGCDAHLVKPSDPDTIRALLAAVRG